MAERSVEFETPGMIEEIYGKLDENIVLLEKQFDVKIVNRDTVIRISGAEENVRRAANILNSLGKFAAKKETIDEQLIRYILSLSEDGNENLALNLIEECICITSAGKPVKPKTHGQKQYVQAIEKNIITFGIGPAGTGKTYLAVAKAANAMRKKDVQKIVLTRPAVEAGEKLGFLPGDLQNKVDPYLRPLYDALFDMFGAESFQRMQEKGIIEVAPLAYLRGRTLDNAFIILDEAQNTTPEQMKMFLTRLGFNSKAVITGDITQIDLPEGKRSGLIEASKILTDIEDIAICRFSNKDVVRHPLVQRIVGAYEKYEKEREKR